jgi:cation:H+ antiporter
MKAYIFYGIAALFIIGSATWLSYIGDEIAEVTGLGATLVGSLFLALTTSLPEVVVSVAALRLGAVDMAVGNIFGSNLFNMCIIIPVDDLFYRGPILSVVSQSHIFTALIGVLMTCVVIIALVYRTERKTLIGVSWDAIALIILFLGFYALFIMGPRLG